jgi:hypothetical protein
VPKKKIWANFQRIIELFTQIIVNKLSKIWVWDPGSGKNLFRIPGADPQHCGKYSFEKRCLWGEKEGADGGAGAHFTKLKIILVLKCRRKKFGPIFKEL